MIIQILFDHDAKLQEFNLKGGDPQVVQRVEKNMRFSFRNKDEESFLSDTVRGKLDFYK
jgi:hypothetical protein